jgi:hypothetical protein
MANEKIRKRPSIDEDYQAQLAKFEAMYFYELPPDGFYLPLGKSGAPIPGLGFNCNKCRIQIPYGAPDEVKHCKRIDSPPKFSWLQRLFGKKLPTWKIR